MTRSIFCLLAIFFHGLLLAQTALQKNQVASQTQENLAAGKRLFEGQCARCHGIGGNGGQGPSLARPTLRHAADDPEVFFLIRNGIQVRANPISFLIDDKQHVAIAAGQALFVFGLLY